MSMDGWAEGKGGEFNEGDSVGLCNGCAGPSLGWIMSPQSMLSLGTVGELTWGFLVRNEQKVCNNFDASSFFLFLMTASLHLFVSMCCFSIFFHQQYHRESFRDIWDIHMQ